jgi:hypothetical protein
MLQCHSKVYSMTSNPVASDWKTLCIHELNRAKAARVAVNEGKARVCARRAAGTIAREYERRRGIDPPGRSAYAAIRELVSIPDIPAGVREVAGHFLERVTTEGKLPIQADLIEEVSWLASKLLGESI